MTSTVLAFALAVFVTVALYHAVPMVWRALTSPLRHLPGPPTDSLFWGNFKIINEAENSVPQEQWVDQYGPTIAYRGIFGVSCHLSTL